MSLKTSAVNVLVRLSRWYLQSHLPRPGKALYWNKVCVPYLIWRKNELVFATQFGARMRLVPSEFIQSRILFFGVWEPNVTTLFQKIVGPGDVVIDVGANAGYYTLLTSQLIGKGGRVYAVEPSYPTREVLKKNLALNGCDNVTILPDAAWDSSSVGTLHLTNHDCGASSLRPLEDGARVEEVRLVRLDDVIPAEDQERVRLIKVDIEGAEAHALRGLSAILGRNPRLQVIAEVNPKMLGDMGSSVADLFSFMEGFGFAAYAIPNDYQMAAYLPPIRYEPPRRLAAPPERPSYILFSRTEPP
jgi:FkbM family methyltransferase